MSYSLSGKLTVPASASPPVADVGETVACVTVSPVKVMGRPSPAPIVLPTSQPRLCSTAQQPSPSLIQPEPELPTHYIHSVRTAVSDSNATSFAAPASDPFSSAVPATDTPASAAPASDPSSSAVPATAVAPLRVPVLRGQIAGHPASILLDTGATCSIVSSSFATRLSLPRRTIFPRNIVFGQGKPETINTQTEVTLSVGPIDTTVSLLVTQLVSSLDVLLGSDCIARLGIVIDLSGQRVLFADGSSVSITPSTNIPLEELSSTQFSKLVNNLNDSSVDSCFVIYAGEVPSGSDSCLAAFTGGKAAAPDAAAFREEVFKDYPDLFPESLPTSLPPQMRDGHDIEHSIELKPNVSPVKQRDYRRGASENATLKELLDQMLREGQIRPSTSPWASPVLLVKKSDGSWRFCVDYRALNAATKKNSYPLPDITTCLDQLHGARFFSSLDLRSGYHQIRMEPKSVPYTAFTTRYGSYEFLVMPFGLCNAPATFQSTMNSLLRPYIDNFLLVYLDDILIYSQSFEQHKSHVRTVLDTLRRAQFYCKPSKCEFGLRQINFVGHTVSHNQVAMQAQKLEALRAWPVPTSVTRLQCFLGFANYYRRFVNNFAQLSTRLSTLASNKFKKLRFTWTPEAQHDFDRLKNEMLKNITLHIPDMSGATPFSLQTDASDSCIAAILSQSNKIVDCFSRKLQGAERNYPIREKELLAIVCALKKYSHFCSNTTITVYTDHRSLIHLDSMQLNTPVPQSRRIARWWMDTLSHFNLKIVYLQGQYNIPADALSRQHIDDSDITTYPASTTAELDHSDTTLHNAGVALSDPDVETVVDPPKSHPSEISRSETNSSNLVATATAVTVTIQDSHLNQIRAGYRSDPSWNPVYMAHLGEGPAPQKGLLLQRFARTSIDPASKLLYYRLDSNATPGVSSERLVIPICDVRNALLHEHHSAPYSGHLGYARQRALMTERFWWPRLTKDLLRFCKSCSECQHSKDLTRARQAPLQPLPVPDQPFTHLTMDFLTGFPVSGGFDSIYVVVDRLTKTVIIAPCSKSIDAKGTAQLFLERVFQYFGTPLNIVSDRGPQFASQFFQEFFKGLGTRLSLSTANHPQSDGLTERYNRVILEILRTLVDSDLDSWHLCLPLIQFAINNTTHSIMRKSPFFLNFNRDAVIPTDLLVGIASPSNKDAAEILADARSTLRHAADLMAQEQELQAERHDRSANLIRYSRFRSRLCSKDCTSSTSRQVRLQAESSFRWTVSYHPRYWSQRL